MPSTVSKEFLKYDPISHRVIQIFVLIDIYNLYVEPDTERNIKKLSSGASFFFLKKTKTKKPNHYEEVSCMPIQTTKQNLKPQGLNSFTKENKSAVS